ncbi:glycosyltransferase family 2 protein [Olleya sp. Bg11-27]|uniref:glycosyltransferase family 2 protein n=1 Tax=Olleya sp. Bg11-27 TaxID=2058135 RepID=UPI000C30904E|nr:glycosyltransferase family 2 protein [Olleya sp. Bg11-27]AUC75608.1 glycosyltransferase family 2 protein [Olleya sp. Bg11-27]
MKNISVIIINYNTASYTLECIQSVIKYTDVTISYDIIVVDNNSDIKDFKLLKNNFPTQDNISLHRSNINTGFGGGNMFGAQFAKSDYLLFLNNDAMLKNDCLSILFNYMENNLNVGVATAQNYDEHDKHVASFDHDKGIRKLLLGRGFLEKHNPQKYPKRKKQYETPLTVNFVNGAFMFFRSSVFAEVGGFDTNIFLYFEEMDICFRMRNLGFSSVLIPEAKILHYQGVSTGMSKLISKEGFLSHIYVIKKNYSYAKYIFIRYYYTTTFLIKPKKWFLLPLILKGASITNSLKQSQKINF